MPKIEILRLWWRVVGERPDSGEAHLVREGGAVGSENAGMSSVWM